MTLGRKIGRALIALLALGAIGAQAGVAWGAQWVADNRQWVSDRAIALQFEPSPELYETIAQASMSDQAKIYFYASLPEVVEPAEFDRYCSRDEPGIGVLGCYRLAEKRIFLYDVTDERLQAMEPVIAAHEMLHAVWDRFDSAEQERLGVLLEQGFAALSADHPLRERIASYEENDPRSRIPELYALMGTEISALPTELEQHYSTYFIDRQQVVALADQVYTIFDGLSAELQGIADDLRARSEVIDQRKAQYELDAAVLGADIEVYNDRVARYNSGEDVRGAEDFDQERDELIARQDALRAERESIQALIDEYNSLLDELEILNQELTELNQGINVNLESQETVEDTDEVSQSEG